MVIFDLGLIRWYLTFELLRFLLLYLRQKSQSILYWHGPHYGGQIDLKYLTVHQSLLSTGILGIQHHSQLKPSLLVIHFYLEFTLSTRLCLICYIGKSNHILFPNYGVELDVVISVLSSIHVSSLSLIAIVSIRLWPDCGQVNKHHRVKVSSRSLCLLLFLAWTLHCYPTHIFHLINSKSHFSERY